jgi:hypothetical protein
MGPQATIIYTHLRTLKEQKKFTTYKEIGELLGLYHRDNELNSALGEVLEYAYKYDNLPLTVIVCYSDKEKSYQPAPLFYKLMKNLDIKYIGMSNEEIQVDCLRKLGYD